MAGKNRSYMWTWVARCTVYFGKNRELSFSFFQIIKSKPVLFNTLLFHDIVGVPTKYLFIVSRSRSLIYWNIFPTMIPLIWFHLFVSYFVWKRFKRRAVKFVHKTNIAELPPPGFYKMSPEYHQPHPTNVKVMKTRLYRLCRLYTAQTVQCTQAPLLSY